jgi:hypothetical protein
MIRFRQALAALFLLAGFAVAAPASAQQLVSATNPQQIANVMRDKGFNVELTTDGEGDPMIKSDIDGTLWVVVFYNCTDNKNCKTLQFYMGFTEPVISNDRMNGWNQKHRFAFAYNDEEGDPVLEMDLDTDHGGMPRVLFEDNLDTWSSLANQFMQFVAEDE